MEKLAGLAADSLTDGVDLGGVLEVIAQGIPVNYAIDGSAVKLFVDKAFIEKITPLILAFAGKMDNSALGNMGGFIKGMLQGLSLALQKTTKLEIGFNVEEEPRL